MTDASDVGIGAVLSQFQNGREVPIAFASRTLTPTERRYATNEREALGCVWAIEHWAKYLLGKAFTLRTDHAGLTSILGNEQHNKRTTDKFARYRERLEAFDFKPEYLKGEENAVADALSRLTTTEAQRDAPIGKIGSIRRDNVEGASQRDTTICRVVEFVSAGWPDKKRIEPPLLPYYHAREELHMDDGLLKRSKRTVVPRELMQTLLHRAHEGHPGIVRMKRKMRESYWWPGMDRAIEQHVQHCYPCQRSSKSRPTTAVPAISLPVETVPGRHYAIDITGPCFNGNNVVCLIDYATRFPETLTTKKTTSAVIINWLKGIFARYGTPDILTSDNGPQFVSDEFREFLGSRDIEHHRAAVYNPQENGVVENFNRYIKHGIEAFTAENIDWDEGMHHLLSQFRATSPVPNGKSPAETFLGRPIRLPFQLKQKRDELRAQRPVDDAAANDNDEEMRQPTAPIKPRCAAFKKGELVVTKRPHRQESLLRAHAS